MPKTQTADAHRIVIFGATGRLGQKLTAAFHEAGHSVLAAGRSQTALEKLPGETQRLDLSDNNGKTDFIRSGDVVINGAHARFTETIAKMCPPDIARLVVIGSTRYLTHFPDEKAAEVIAAARFLETSKLPWVLLHPTMIYGAQGENNVQRMADLIQRLHVIPLPNGGRALIQPVHVGDVVSSVVRAAAKPGIERKTIHLGGPEAIPYADFLHAIARANGAWVRIVSLPVPLLRLIVRLTKFVPGIPAITENEVMRLLEDKSVDVSEMKNALGVSSRSLELGLRQTFNS